MSSAAQPFSNQTPQGWRHVCDLIQSRPPEGGNSKFLPTPVATVAASWFFSSLRLLPAVLGFRFPESLDEELAGGQMSSHAEDRRVGRFNALE